MVLNKKAQSQPFFLFMIGVIIFLLVFGLVGSLIKNSNKVRSDMDCGNSSISTQDKINCTTVDVVAPFILAVIIGLAGVAFTARLIGG